MYIYKWIDICPDINKKMHKEVVDATVSKPMRGRHVWSSDRKSFGKLSEKDCEFNYSFLFFR